MTTEPFYTDPAAEQSSEQIEKFLRAICDGDEVAIHNRQGGQNLLEIEIATVTEVRPRGRLWTDKSAPYGDNRWFMKSGSNCGAPTGKSRLVIPTEEVRRFAEEKRFALDQRPFTAERIQEIDDQWNKRKDRLRKP